MGLCNSKLATSTANNPTEPGEGKEFTSIALSYEQQVSKLIRAVNKGDIYTVHEYLRQDGDVNYSFQEDIGKTTLLNLACSRGHYEIAKLLLDNRANPNYLLNEIDFPPINWACYNLNLDLVKLLLQHKVEVKLHYFNNNAKEPTDIILAYFNNNHNLAVSALILSELINNGGEIKDENQVKNLMRFSSEKGCSDLLAAILDARAKNIADFDINKTEPVANSTELNETISRANTIEYCIYDALRNNHGEILKTFLEHGYNQRNLMSKAVYYNRYNIVKLLIDEYGFNKAETLDLAIKTCSGTAFSLLKHYNFREEHQKFLKSSILHDNFEVAKSLIKEYNISLGDSDIRYCAQNNKIKMLEYFLEEYNLPGNRAASIAIEENKYELVKTLIEHNFTTANIAYKLANAKQHSQMSSFITQKMYSTKDLKEEHSPGSETKWDEQNFTGLRVSGSSGSSAEKNISHSNSKINDEGDFPYNRIGEITLSKDANYPYNRIGEINLSGAGSEAHGDGQEE